jgi:penicillin-insensitive murein endopeptidase
MLLDPKAHVSHIFIAEPLRQHLLAHAKSIGVAHRLWDRAAMTLMQPSNSLPHDDHMHVRISCPRAMHATCVELAKGALPAHAAHPEATTNRHAHAVVLKTPSAASQTTVLSKAKVGELPEEPMRSPADDVDTADSVD